MRLGFELELFKSPIGVSVFGSETRITRSIASKIYTKNNLYVPHLRCEIQVSTFSRFKVIAFFTSVAELVILHEKKHGEFRREASRKSQRSSCPPKERCVRRKMYKSSFLYQNLIRYVKKYFCSRPTTRKIDVAFRMKICIRHVDCKR